LSGDVFICGRVAVSAASIQPTNNARRATACLFI
jgi:hypothetical protein